MQDLTILGNAAIDGSVYRCIAENYHYALRHAVKMPLASRLSCVCVLSTA